MRFVWWILLVALGSVLEAGSLVELWPEGKTPGQVTRDVETEIERNDGFRRVTNVSCPTLELFRAKGSDSEPKPGMVICPGGGYRYTVMDKEGSHIAQWLNQVGITALVLKYRTPNNREGALQDIQRALSMTRAQARQWNIDPKRVGVIGFSAGGNLAAKASTSFDARAYDSLDAIDQVSCRPDFAVLVYPAYLNDGKGKVAADLDLSVNVPPTLIIHTEDDTRLVVGSKIYSTALKEKRIPHEFKLYRTGGHGYGLKPEGDARAWPGDAIDWLRSIGIR